MSSDTPPSTAARSNPPSPSTAVPPTRRFTRQQILFNGIVLVALVSLFLFGPRIATYALPWFGYDAEDLDRGMVERDEVVFSKMSVTDSHLRRAIRKQPQVSSVYFVQCSISPEALGLLGQLTNINTLEFHDQSVALELLPPLPKLATLRLRHCSTPTADQLAALSRQPRLTHLILDDAGIGDAEIAGVSKLSGLKALALSRAGITDAGVASLAGISGLNSLHMRGTRITDASVPHLATIPQLMDIDVQETALTASGLYQLIQANPALRVEFTASGLQPTFAEFAVLRQKSVSGLDQGQVAAVRQIQAITLPLRDPVLWSKMAPEDRPQSVGVYVEEAPVDPAHPQGFRVVVDLTSHVPTLEVLDAIGAWNVPVSIHWWPQEEIALVDRLLRIPQLQSLELEISNAAVVGPLADAFAKMPHVPVVDAHIDETGDPQFAQHREAVAAALARIPKLKSLRWDGPGEAPLSAFRGHQELSSLGCFAPRVTDAVTADLRAIPRLERLNLQTTEEITEEQVGQLLKDGPPVKYLDLRVETLKAQANLKAKFPAVEFSFQSQ